MSPAQARSWGLDKYSAAVCFWPLVSSPKEPRLPWHSLLSCAQVPAAAVAVVRGPTGPALLMLPSGFVTEL